MASLNDSYSIVGYVAATTQTSSKCCFIIGYRITNTDRSTAKHTIELLPVVAGTNTLFYNGAGSKTTLTVGGQTWTQTYSPKTTWSTADTITANSKTYTHVGYLLDNQSDATPTMEVQGSFDNTTSVAVSMSYYGGSSAYNIGAKTVTASGTITLPKVTPLNSSITNNSSSSNRIDFGSNVTFTITRPTSSTTHTLTYTPSGGSAVTIGSGIETSKTYAFPTSYINNYPNTATPNITVTNTNTYNTTSTTTVYLKVPDSYVPTGSATFTTSSFVPDGASGNTSYLGPLLYQGHSKLTATISASGVAGSTITSYNSTAEGISYSTASFTTGVLKNSGYQTADFTVKDSRGRTTTFSKDYYVISYYAPSISNLRAMRCLADGTLSEEGTYAKVSFDYNVSDAEGDNYFYITLSCGDQTLELSYEDINYSGTYESGAVFSGLSTDSAYIINAVVSDCFYGDVSAGYPYAAAVVSTTVSPSAVTISKLAGGKGVSFGQTATEEGLHSYMTSTFHDKVYIKNNENGTNYLREIRDLIYPVGSIYMSVKNTNPKFLFGGEWAALTDRFLIGAGNSYAVNATGGSTDLASHTHSIPALSGTAASNGGHAHTYYLPPSWSFKIGTSTKNTVTDEAASGLTAAYSTSSNGAHTHSVSTNASTSGSTGAGNAGNMPPYLAVYMWKRTG